MESRWKRRDFLKAATVAGAGSWLASCTALDRLLMGQSADNTDRVVILGAGMAGLRAAYELRKKNIPYRIFEGGERVGGRAHTVEGLTASGQSGELGCEWFSKEQTVFWDLAKELHLEIIEVAGQRDHLFLQDDSGLNQIPQKDLQTLRDLARKAEDLSTDKASLQRGMYDWKDRHNAAPKPLTALEWASQFSDDVAWKQLVNGWSVFRYGVPANEVRSFGFARAFLFAENILDPWGGMRFKFRGGSSSLAAAMTDRVMGVIPNDRLVMGHRLLRVEKLAAGGFELHFDAPDGRKRYKALNVICALPWAVLPTIEGFEDFTGSTLLQQPALAHQAKILMTFSDRFWRKRWDQGRLISEEPVWESSYRIQEWLQNPSGILSQVVSGEKAKSPDPAMVEAALSRLATLEKLPNLPLIDSQIHSFSVSSLAMARGSYPAVSRNERVFELPEEHWVWAGEHTASEEGIGTWAGALDSGLKAVKPFLESAGVSDKA